MHYDALNGSLNGIHRRPVLCTKPKEFLLITSLCLMETAAVWLRMVVFAGDVLYENFSLNFVQRASEFDQSFDKRFDQAERPRTACSMSAFPRLIRSCWIWCNNCICVIGHEKARKKLSIKPCPTPCVHWASSIAKRISCSPESINATNLCSAEIRAAIVIARIRLRFWRQICRQINRRNRTNANTNRRSLLASLQKRSGAKQLLHLSVRTTEILTARTAANSNCVLMCKQTACLCAKLVRELLVDGFTSGSGEQFRTVKFAQRGTQRQLVVFLG